MPNPEYDRGILFGLLAVQMGIVRRDALIAAVKAWVENKAKPIDQIMLEQKALGADTRALVAALLQKHLEIHENDVEKSLAALSSVGSVRQDLAAIADAELQATVDHVPRDLAKEAEPTIHLVSGTPTSKGQRFRIVRPHAKGGLGVVFVAHDEELQRDVALKEIQERFAEDSASRTRFMLEAEITGGLEHPGIVPVYGLGQYADGRPFYAMRFIRGDSLRDAIEKYHASQPRLDPSSVAFRELLERLIDVCNAIQYAHDRGVLHRDLKPGNIMLGKYGETLVVDWGLAKTIGDSTHPERPTEEPLLRPASASGSAATIMGTAVGTPQFMSPEQAAGQLDKLGPASDIYSLGATLYCLLTGQAPFERLRRGKQVVDVAQLLAKVKKGEFVRPTAIKPEIDRALEAICLKAMALKPEARYAMPRDMMQDLRNWLADEPVGAYPDPWTITARRWIGKHRTLVTGCAVAVLVGIVSLVTSTVLLAQKNDELTSANNIIKKQNEDIKQEADEKERQRKLAESRLRQSLAAVGLFANDARKYCEDALVPRDSRGRLYEVLIKQLEEQAEQEPGEATIDRLRNKSLMFKTLCAVHLDFNSAPKSKQAYDKGIHSVDQWDKLRPADSEAQAFRAAFLHLRAHGLTLEKKDAEARRFHQEALAIRRKLAGDVDADLPAKADAVAAVADSLDGLEQFAESLALREKICRHFEQLEKQFKTKAERNAVREQSYPYREARCWTYQKAGLHAIDYATRKKNLSASDVMSDQLMKERPSNRAVRLRWATTVKMLGELEYNFGKLAEKEGKKKEAEKYFADAAEFYKKLNQVSRGLATSDELVNGLRDYSRSFYTLGLAEQRKGNIAAARKLYERSRVIRNEVFLDHQASAMSLHLQIDLFFSQIALGQIREPIEMIENLFVIFREEEPDVSYRAACLCALAIEAIEETRKPDPLTANDKRIQMRLRETAITCLQIAHDGGFSDFFQTSIDSDFDAIRDDPRMTEFEATHQYRLGMQENKRGDARQAAVHFHQARKLVDDWLKSKQAPSRRLLLSIDRMCIQLRLGQTQDVLVEANAFFAQLEKNRPAMFRLARVYAIAAAGERDAARQTQFRDKALLALEKSGDFATQFRLTSQEDFDFVRDDLRFRKILERTRK